VTDWKERAEREACALLDGIYGSQIPLSRATLIPLLAAAWLQGVNLGSHETLAAAEMAFERMQAEL
jgi:hypothetical protein